MASLEGLVDLAKLHQCNEWQGHQYLSFQHYLSESGPYLLLPLRKNKKEPKAKAAAKKDTKTKKETSKTVVKEKKETSKTVVKEKKESSKTGIKEKKDDKK